MPVKNFRTFIAVIIALLGIPLSQLAAQADSAGFVFTTATHLDATPIKNQSKTGTCWSFATSSFLESELLRMGKGEHD
ncbi:MAG: aminopeptidase, partial [Calditrichaeota bacterium]|nr:aminopeptidase [Calditrichota bacterium]